VDGLLVIDKPAGPTSHDVVACLRRVLGEHRIGHTGTLDPAASGVLPLVLGRATRLARFLSASDKSYEAVIRVGVATDTYDGEGAPVGTAHDVGQRLGSGAHLAALRRTSSGDFTLADALSFDEAERDHDLACRAVVPLAQMLPRWSSVVLTDEGARRVAHGRDVGPDDITEGVLPSWQHVRLPPPVPQAVRLLDPQGELIAIAEPCESLGVLHPSVVLV